MKNKIVHLGLLLIVVIMISMMAPFSRLRNEGFDGSDSTSNQDATSPTQTAHATASPLPTTPITENSDFISAVNTALNSPANNDTDKAAIQNIQSRISGLSSTNAKTLLGEIGNPANLSNPRVFLQYMNWFSSSCPIDSSTCSGAK